ncbi:MAG: hypothetical protein J6D54_00035 [Olsenella sp.]|nr:hypothetical protein [Olsenella sp.]
MSERIAPRLRPNGPSARWISHLAPSDSRNIICRKMVCSPPEPSFTAGSTHAILFPASSSYMHPSAFV